MIFLVYTFAYTISSYEHQSINEPAIVLGGAFVVDAVEKDESKGPIFP